MQQCCKNTLKIVLKIDFCINNRFIFGIQTKKMNTENYQENKIYKILVEKSNEDFFTKHKVRMPSIHSIREFLKSINIDTNEDSSTFLKIGRYNVIVNDTLRMGWNININVKSSTYTRNSEYVAKKIINYIDSVKK